MAFQVTPTITMSVEYQKIYAPAILLNPSAMLKASTLKIKKAKYRMLKSSPVC